MGLRTFLERNKIKDTLLFVLLKNSLSSPGLALGLSALRALSDRSAVLAGPTILQIAFPRGLCQLAGHAAASGWKLHEMRDQFPPYLKLL